MSTARILCALLLLAVLGCVDDLVGPEKEDCQVDTVWLKPTHHKVDSIPAVVEVCLIYYPGLLP